jgi:hypothetical protein
LAASNAARNRTIRDVAVALGRDADAVDLTFIPLKGAGWLFDGSESDDASWRYMLDLDLLAVPDADRAFALMRAAGWTENDGVLTKLDPSHAYCRSFARPGRGFQVEVHRDPGFHPTLLGADQLWEQATPVAPGLAVPAPWHRACHAIIHWQMQDGGEGLIRQAAEVARFASRPDVDWPAVLRHARAAGFEPAVMRGLALARELLCAPVPAGVALSAETIAWARAAARPRSAEAAHVAGVWSFVGAIWRSDDLRYVAGREKWPAWRRHLAMTFWRAFRMPNLLLQIALIPSRLVREWLSRPRADARRSTVQSTDVAP